MHNAELARANNLDESLLNDPDFRRLLARRSRLRWGLSGVLITAYLTWALAGIYAQDALAVKFMGWSVSWGIVVGYFIIALSIALSLMYVRIVNRLHLSHHARQSLNNDG
jgi:uncharacterized membrane protein (DUF485 family)